MNNGHKDIESCNNNNHQKQEVVLEEELQGLVNNSRQTTTISVPFEITSRQSFNTDSVEDNNSSSPLPSKRLFFNISNRAPRSSSSCCIKKKRSRRIKSILAIIIAIIILLSVALITRRAFSSSQSASFDWTEDSSSKDDNTDNISNMTPSSNNNANNKDTTACNYNTGQCDKPYKDPNNHHILNEPNPPQLPSSMILFHPPTCYAESLDIMNKVKEYSDPIATWDDHVATTNTNNGNNDTNSNNNNMNQPNNNKDEEERPENYPKYTYTATKHFITQRTALLFAPGSYPNVDFEVGYYTSVLGLGKQPTDTQFTGNKGPYVEATDKYTNRPPFGSGLDTFWRSIENISHMSQSGSMSWVVSQAAPIRRVHVHGNLNLFDSGAYVSGGHSANLIVDGQVNFGGQQQWTMRNVHLKGGAVNGGWSFVYVGCTGNVPDEDDNPSNGPSVSVEERLHVRIEKPYITMKKDDHSKTTTSTMEEESKVPYQLELRVPLPTFGNETVGPQFDNTNEDVRDFHHVKLGVPSNSTQDAALENYSVLQQALDEGKDVVLSPGIYPLSSSLVVKYPNQVILGLGYATLVAPTDGLPCIAVKPKVPGVRIAGIMLEASIQDKGAGDEGRIRSLLEWGSPTVNDPGDEENPGLLSDVFARVGGNYRNVSTDVMVLLHSGNIYGDNLWLWRADHVQLHPNEAPNFPNISPRCRQTVQDECVVKNGLVVGEHATNVTIVGLAVEHTTEHQTVWNGDNGQVYFYQSELPYDADESFETKKFVGYKVGSNVKNHKAKGLGIYSNFRDYNVSTWTAVEHPKGEEGIEMSNVFTVKLDNMGQINSVVNGRGPGPTNDTKYGTPLRCPDNTC